jgi:hypothetical protein
MPTLPPTRYPTVVLPKAVATAVGEEERKMKGRGSERAKQVRQSSEASVDGSTSRSRVTGKRRTAVAVGSAALVGRAHSAEQGKEAPQMSMALLAGSILGYALTLCIVCTWVARHVCCGRKNKGSSGATGEEMGVLLKGQGQGQAQAKPKGRLHLANYDEPEGTSKILGEYDDDDDDDGPATGHSTLLSYY